MSISRHNKYVGRNQDLQNQEGFFMTNKKTVIKISAQEYALALSKIKSQIKQTQIKATLSANKELIQLYWSIGKTISEMQEQHNWGSSFMMQLAKDLQNSFPGTAGFSKTNIFRMRAFYRAYEKFPQAVGKIESFPIFNLPWGHNAVLLEKLNSEEERIWYAKKAIEYGWSRSMLSTWIKSNLYAREGKAITNFKQTLPPACSDMAQQSLKDPYLFDFLTLHEEHREKEVEQGLMEHIQKFLLELGEGFSFVGRQYHLKVSDSDYYLDLLFYHLKLRCYIVIELKATEFKPEYAGKLNFYLSAVDDLLRHKDDNPSIGLLLCQTKDTFKAEYALRDINKPIGVAKYETEILESLPKNLKGRLPTIEEIEAELEKSKELKKVMSEEKNHG